VIGDDAQVAHLLAGLVEAEVEGVLDEAFDLVAPDPLRPVRFVGQEAMHEVEVEPGQVRRDGDIAVLPLVRRHLCSSGGAPYRKEPGKSPTSFFFPLQLSTSTRKTVVRFSSSRTGGR